MTVDSGQAAARDLGRERFTTHLDAAEGGVAALQEAVRGMALSDKQAVLALGPEDLDRIRLVATELTDLGRITANTYRGSMAMRFPPVQGPMST